MQEKNRQEQKSIGSFHLDSEMMFSKLSIWNGVITLRQMYSTQKRMSDHMCEVVHMYEKEGENRQVFFQSLIVLPHSLASFHTAWSDHLRELTIHNVWHFNTMHDNRWKSTHKTVTNDYRQYNSFWIYSTIFDILPKTSSSRPFWIHHTAAELCSELHPYVTCLTLSFQIRWLIFFFSFFFLFSTFSPASLPLSFWTLHCRSVGLLMVWSICHGLEVANLTCSLGLALL